MKIFLVDDHEILLDGIRGLLLSQGNDEVIGSANSFGEALRKLSYLSPDLVITDYSLPEKSGLDVITAARKLHPSVRIIVLSMHEEIRLVREILEKEVDGYILKKDSHEELVKAVRAVKEGKVYLSSDINELLIKGLSAKTDKSVLTSRETEILKLIGQEFTNKEIGEKLFISERTVETHRKNIFRKTRTNNFVGLIKYAYENDLM